MKGMLLKDLLMVKSNMALLYILFLVLMAVGGEGSIFLLIVYGMSLTTSILSLDEMSRTDRLMPMLPLSDLECVMDKYLMLYGHLFLISIATAAGEWIRTGTFPNYLLFAIAILLILHAVFMPIMIRFGVEKGRLLFLLAILIGSSVLGITKNETDSIGTVYMGLVIAAVFQFISIFVSAKMYRERVTA